MVLKIKLGPAGSPTGSSLEGVEYVKNSGLAAMEIEFVYGVKMSNKLAKAIGEVAKKLNINLSVHAPYYINLNSKEKAKVNASKKRILTSCERGNHLGAKNIVFHPGYYGKFSKEETYENIKNAVLDINKVIKEKKWGVKLAPETTGKVNVFGDLDEILKLVKDCKCSLCIDFAHLKARYQGKIDYDEVFKKLKRFKHIHCHFSGIRYGEKGERNHEMTKEKDIKDLGKYLKKYKINATIINESPDPLGDSLKTKKIFEEIGIKI